MSTFPLGVCGLAMEAASGDEGRFLGAEPAFLRRSLILVNNIPTLGNAAKAQRNKLKSCYRPLRVHVAHPL